MSLKLKKKTTSEVLKEVTSYNNSSDSDRISLYEIKVALHERGFGILMLLFALPLSIPMPVPPGYTSILSIPLLLFSSQLFIGFDAPWLPKWLEKKSIKRSTLALFFEKAAPLLKKLEAFTRERLTFFFSSFGEKLIAFIIILDSISIFIPLPLTNFIPALGVVVMSLGLFSKDGLMVIIGTIISFCGLLLTSIILIFGPKIIIEMFTFVKKFI